MQKISHRGDRHFDGYALTVRGVIKYVQLLEKIEGEPLKEILVFNTNISPEDLAELNKNPIYSFKIDRECLVATRKI